MINSAQNEGANGPHPNYCSGIGENTVRAVFVSQPEKYSMIRVNKNLDDTL